VTVAGTAPANPATPQTPSAGASAATPAPSAPSGPTPAAPKPGPSGAVAGATATSPAVRALTAARSVALRTLARRGLLVRLVAPSGTRALDVRLYRVVTKRVDGRRVTRRTRVLRGAIPVRHGGRLTVRWRPRRADLAKLRSGNYVLRIRAGRDRSHLAGAAAERTLRLTGARVSA
jgi:hypothetical protein